MWIYIAHRNHNYTPLIVMFHSFTVEMRDDN